MKRVPWIVHHRIWLCSLALALCASSPALAIEIPERDGWVVDRAELLSEERQARLEQELGRFARDEGPQIVVHTTPSLEGLSIDDYSLRVALAWGVGRAGRDDGVVLTVAPNERKVRIEVGNGLNRSLGDEKAARIIQDTILPDFRKGNFANGIERGVAEIQRSVARKAAARGSARGFYTVVILGGLVFAALWLLLLRGLSRLELLEWGDGYHVSRYRQLRSYTSSSSLSRSRSGSSSRGSSSSTSRGGGRLGGGGASGSW